MDETIDETVSRIVRARLSDAEIDSIAIEADDDSDGDPILRITVVFASDPSIIKPDKLASLVRHIRPRLIEGKEYAFPIFSFISKRDRDRLRHAAA